MKKISLLVIMLLTAFMFVPNIEAKEKINVYMFRGEGCPHCEEALEFFGKLEKDEEYSKYYTLKKYEVWYDEKNQELMEKVSKELKENASGVPYIVIGKKTFSGYASDMDDQIKSEIKKAYESKSYVDVVKKVQTVKKDNGSVVPIVITIGVAVLIIGGLVVLTRKM